MTSIDRTIYRRMKRNYTTKELIEAYTPTEEERRESIPGRGLTVVFTDG